MTPRQRRLHQQGLVTVATAPRKSWLGRFTPLTNIQGGWIKSLLSTWGEGVRGGAAPRMPREHSCWNVIRRGRWSDKALERFTVALEQARNEGFKGEQALKRAHCIIWPQTPSSVIDEAITNDDVDFIEESVLSAFDISDPVYIVGLQYYTTRRKIADISRELQAIAPWLTDGEARKRVRWCLEIFRAKVFLSSRKLMEE
ncbi:hypothetical protein [Kluyvera genomosp. 1]|uniref:hypothetical protein n=1 Tax=Kluyvera genomosp. 1 TaxID=2774053 RepID=UPI00068C987D|nr:hypothetical protein [Kluyvera genomosp. 1]